jgi:hypothetical protein
VQPLDAKAVVGNRPQDPDPVLYQRDQFAKGTRHAKVNMRGLLPTLAAIQSYHLGKLVHCTDEGRNTLIHPGSHLDRNFGVHA